MNTRTHRIPTQAGKLKFETHAMTVKKNPKDQRQLYTFTREQIEQHDISAFLGTFSPDRPSEELQSMMSNVVFAVSGYDDEPDPLCVIPEVRAFFAQCHQWWPCWNSFSDLRSQSLAMIACCILPNVSILRFMKAQEIEATLRHKELIIFFEHGLASSALLHSRAKIDKIAGMRLLRRVSYFLQLPE